MAKSPDDDVEDKPLDPAVERVREKLLRFVVINLAILFAAVIVVVAAVVYRSQTRQAPPPVVPDAPVPGGGTLEADIPVPAGARIVSQSLFGNRLSLDVETAGGMHTILIYDLAERRVVARLSVKPQ